MYALLSEVGFVDLQSHQTLFGHPDEMREPDPVENGFGRGSFVVVRGWKPPREDLAIKGSLW